MLDEKKTAEEISDILGLEPLALEGGMWTQTFKDKNSTAIYYLLSENNFSAIASALVGIFAGLILNYALSRKLVFNQNSI